jgi:hypothetical protein
MAKMDPDEVRRRLEQEAADEELARKLDSDPEFAKDFDKSFERQLGELNTEFLNKFAQDKGYSKSETEAMKRAVEKARRTAQGGWFSPGNPAEAEKILMSNRGIREARKSKGKGCAVIALLIFGGSAATSVGTIWAAAEIVSRVLS